MDSRWEGEFYVVLDNHVDSRWQGGVSYNVVLDNHVNSRRVGGFTGCHLQPCRMRTLIGMGGEFHLSLTNMWILSGVIGNHADSRW